MGIKEIAQALRKYEYPPSFHRSPAAGRVNPEHRAPGLVVCDFQLTTVLGDDGLAQVQAQTQAPLTVRPALSCRVKQVEQVLFCLIWDSGAVI